MITQNGSSDASWCENMHSEHEKDTMEQLGVILPKTLGNLIAVEYSCQN
jgi:hypothetical protein